MHVTVQVCVAVFDYEGEMDDELNFLTGSSDNGFQIF